MTREANDALIAALQLVDGVIVQVRKNPPALSAEDYQQLLAVYRDGTFHGFYGQIDDFSPGDVVATLTADTPSTAGT